MLVCNEYPSGGDDYVYDPNGNMTQDLNKGIKGATLAEKGIEYNHLNLPTLVRVNNGTDVGAISYIYDATGVKLRKNVLKKGETTPTATDFAGNYIYENNKLQFFSTPEGYATPKNVNNYSAGFDYVYNYVDHLGSVRLSYSDLDLNGAIDPSTEILHERNTYPFGLEHKGYNNVINGTENNYQTYLGQEMNEELGLNWLTFRHRNYMPELGRFFGVDPISEDYLTITNYQFAHNNPVWKIEIEGLEGTPSNGKPDVVNNEPVQGHTNKGSNNIVAGGVAANFGHSFLAQAFVYNYANGQGRSMTLNESGMETVRAAPVSINEGSSSGSTADSHRRSELKTFNDAFSSLEAGKSKYFETGVNAKANNQGTLGTFTIYFQGMLTKDGNGTDWSFDGQMSFYDEWDFDKKEDGTRSQSSEDATAIGGKLLDGGKGFDIYSYNVNVKQSSKDNNVDWFNGKSSETKKTIHNRLPNWLTEMIEGWFKD